MSGGGGAVYIYVHTYSIFAFLSINWTRNSEAEGERGGWRRVKAGM
jgi:hypothetical protein